MHELFKKRSNNFVRGLYTKREMFEAIIPYWEMEDGVLKKLEVFPVELGFGQPRSTGGWPKPAGNMEFVDRLIEMSKPYGTSMKFEDGIIKVM